MNAGRTSQAIRKFADALLNLEREIATDTGDQKSRNSVLLTFVLAFETFWKVLKFVLFQMEGIDAASPKEVLRNAFQLGWLGEEDVFWLNMADDRNLVAHTYSEQQAIAIYERVQAYAVALRALFNRLQAKHPDLFTEVT